MTGPRKKNVRRGHVRAYRGAWAVVVSLGTDPGSGKRLRRWYYGYATKQDAEQAVTKLLKAKDEGAWIDPSRLTVGGFLVERWLPAIEHTVRRSTFRDYASVIDTHIVPALGALRLQRVGPADLNRLYAAMLGRGLSPARVRRVHVTLHRAFSAAERWSLLPRNAAKLADPPKLRRAEMKTWTAEQLRAFLGHVREDRLYGAWHLAAFTGMRRGEVLGLRWGDLDLEAAVLRVVQTLVSVGYVVSVSEPKTARGRRSVDLDAGTVAVLRAHRARQLSERVALGLGRTGAEDLVFSRPDGSPLHPDGFTGAFDRHVKTAGLPRVRLHDLRHTYATLALTAGIHVKVVSERLGHASVSITLDTYSHVLPGLQAEAAEKIAGLVLG